MANVFLGFLLAVSCLFPFLCLSFFSSSVSAALFSVNFSHLTNLAILLHSQESILVVDVIVLEMVDGGMHLKYGNGGRVKAHTCGHLFCVKTRIISVSACIVTLTYTSIIFLMTYDK